MDIGDYAVELHAQGNNCAQCVLKSCSEYTKMDESTAYGIANGFGGGVRSGEICGAISGGVMALGLAAHNNGNDSVAQIVKRYVEEFSNEYGCVRCADLKNKKISCDTLIRFAADTVEKYISQF